MDFKSAYKEFVESHCNRRTGPRQERLRQGHGHAEKCFLQKVWWPAFHHFDDLHPEYKVHDFKDGYRYDGWHVLRFTFDDVDEHPRLCQQTLHQLTGRLLGDASAAMRSLSVIDREVIRLAMRSFAPSHRTGVHAVANWSYRRS